MAFSPRNIATSAGSAPKGRQASRGPGQEDRADDDAVDHFFEIDEMSITAARMLLSSSRRCVVLNRETTVSVKIWIFA